MKAYLRPLGIRYPRCSHPRPVVLGVRADPVDLALQWPPWPHQDPWDPTVPELLKDTAMKPDYTNMYMYMESICHSIHVLRHVHKD